MRRFLLWTALVAIVVAALAGVAFWAYWHFFSRFQPVVISRNQAEIQQLLDEASWVSAGGGDAPIYVIGYRDSTATQRYEREELAKLRTVGIEPRIIMFARPDLSDGTPQSTAPERATVAELWLTRDWTLYQRWMATPSASWTAAGLPTAEGNIARSYIIDGSRQFNDRLSALLKDAGVKVSYPLVLWRDRQGNLKACGCEDSRTWAFVRDDMGAPDRLSPADAADIAYDGADTDAVPGDGTPPDVTNNPAMPYPHLAPYAPGRPQATEPDRSMFGFGSEDSSSSEGARPYTPSPAPSATVQPPRQPAPREPATPRAPPQPQKQDDTTFF